jgi:hypothetical protein
MLTKSSLIKTSLLMLFLVLASTALSNLYIVGGKNIDLVWALNGAGLLLLLTMYSVFTKPNIKIQALYLVGSLSCVIQMFWHPVPTWQIKTQLPMFISYISVFLMSYFAYKQKRRFFDKFPWFIMFLYEASSLIEFIYYKFIMSKSETIRTIKQANPNLSYAVLASGALLHSLPVLIVILLIGFILSHNLKIYIKFKGLEINHSAPKNDSRFYIVFTLPHTWEGYVKSLLFAPFGHFRIYHKGLIYGHSFKKRENKGLCQRPKIGLYGSREYKPIEMQEKRCGYRSVFIPIPGNYNLTFALRRKEGHKWSMAESCYYVVDEVIFQSSGMRLKDIF